VESLDREVGVCKGVRCSVEVSGPMGELSRVELGLKAGFCFSIPVYIRLVLEIHRWPRSLSSLVGASTPRYYFNEQRSPSVVCTVGYTG
jgi:hypothetical protein